MAKKLRLSNVTIGADIEVFLKNKVDKGFVSAETIIKGTKAEPHFFLEGNPFFQTSLDNVMVEFGIPPAKKAKEFTNYIGVALDHINREIPSILAVEVVPAALIPNHFLQTENAKMFGCEPDYNAWTMGGQNPRPVPSGNLRTAGGHIHIGYEAPNYNLSMELIRAMDIFVGLAGVVQEPPNERKKLYGKAGAHRIKEYGTEYRTVSNYYIKDEVLTEQVFNNTMAAVEFVNDGIELSRTDGDAIQLAINTGDQELAQTLIDYFGVKLAA